MDEKQKLGALLVTWAGALGMIYGLGQCLQQLNVAPVTGLLLQEGGLLIATWAVNRFWLRVPFQWWSSAPLGQQIRVNVGPIGYLALLVLALSMTPQADLDRLGLAILLAALVGIFEESLFRGILLGGLIQCWHWRGHRSVVGPVILSSGLFAAAHGINLFHQSLPVTGVQILGTFALGLFLGTVYLRSRSLVWPIVIHGTQDLIGFVQRGFSAPGADPRGLVAMLIEICVMAGYLAWMLRPSQRPAILRAWPAVRIARAGK